MYLATQLIEIGIPLILALNMIDVVEKNGDTIDTKKIENILKCKVVEISALHHKNINTLIEEARKLAATKNEELITFDSKLEEAFKEIENFSSIRDHISKRWLAVKMFEEDEKVLEDYSLTSEESKRLKEIRDDFEEAYDDDAEGIVTDNRYNFVTKLTQNSVKKKNL